jgi:peptidoglycan L-alanyl-D-glutamate endopeptidase CwlK
MFKLGTNSINNLAGVDGRLIDIADLAITLSNIDFGIPSTGGLRTEAVQAKLFADGVSKADGVNNKSYHQSGKALDVYELKWGGLWKSWQDMPHFEIKD